MATKLRLLVLVVAGLLFVWLPVVGCADRSARREAPPAPSRSGGSTEALERWILERTNRERRQRRLSALEPESTLAEIARRHSADMLARDYFAHESPEGETPSDRIFTRHRRLIGLTGENIWSGSGYDTSDPAALAREIVDDWMSSPGHRENILRPEYTHLGVGVVATGSEIRATQNFALVRAYLERPLPAELRGDAVSGLSSAALDGGSAAELFDLWSPRRQRAVTEPTPLRTSTVDVAPGSYSLRFYFPEGSPGSYVIYFGPRVAVR